jgi:hypothetical protein
MEMLDRDLTKAARIVNEMVQNVSAMKLTRYSKTKQGACIDKRPVIQPCRGELF